MNNDNGKTQKKKIKPKVKIVFNTIMFLVLIVSCS